MRAKTLAAYESAGTAAVSVLLLFAASRPIVESDMSDSTPLTSIFSANSTGFVGVHSIATSYTHQPMSSARGLLTEFAALPPNWDSYAAAPIAEVAIAAAGQLLDDVETMWPSVPSTMLRPYFVAPLASGGVQIEWRGLDSAIEVVVNSEGRLGFLTEDLATATQIAEVGDASSDEVLGAVAQVLLTTAGA